MRRYAERPREPAQASHRHTLTGHGEVLVEMARTPEIRVWDTSAAVRLTGTWQLSISRS